MASTFHTHPEFVFTSPGLPGGSFLAAVTHRQFMQLSDRGGASNSIGDRWADVCATELACQSNMRLATGESLRASRSLRLDDIPEIARRASRAQLQNPDFLLVGEDTAGPVMWAADAKFSVDTARSRQVSTAMLTALLDMGEDVTDLLGDVPPGARLIDGTFLCPDYPLTHLLLTERRGPRRTTVRSDEVRLVQVDADDFLGPMGQQRLRDYLVSLDAFPFDAHSSLLVGLYYYRLARAAIGCWIDQSSPLIAYRDRPPGLDDLVLEEQARELVTGRMSAWGLILRWNDLAEETRQQRLLIDRASAPPINGRRLRDVLEQEATKRGVVPPSTSKVRRLVGAWFRSQVREQFGPTMPPIRDFDQLLADVSRFSRSLDAETERKTAEITQQLLQEAEPSMAGAPSAGTGGS